MSDSVENNWEKINSTLNRLDEIKIKIETDFPSFDFVYRLRYFRDQFQLIKNELDDVFKDSVRVPSAEEIKSTYPKVRRNVLFYFLLTEMVFQHFKNDQNLNVQNHFKVQMKDILKDFSDKGELVIAKSFRNILAHIRPFDDETLMYEATILISEYKVSFKYDIAKSDWEKLIPWIRSKFDEPAKSNGILTLRKFSYQIHNPETKKNETNYTLLPIIAEGIQSIFEMLNTLEKNYKEAHSDEIVKRDALLTEEAKLEEWLASVGVGQPEI